MKTKIVMGNKTEDDRVLLIKTDGWELLSYDEIMMILGFCFRNEARLYGDKLGGEFLFNRIRNEYNKIVKGDSNG